MDAIRRMSQTQTLNDNTLSVDALLAMTPIVNGQDLVAIACRHLFLSHVKSQPVVREVFFPSHQKDQHEQELEDTWFEFDRFAVYYACQALCKLEDEFTIHTLLDKEAVDEEMDSYFSSPDWKKIGFALYTLLFQDLVKDEDTKTPFRAFLESDRRMWAMKLTEKVKNSHWVYKLIQPVIKGEVSDKEYNRDLNILFIKLHLLDPTSVMPIYDYLRKALPDLNLNMVTTNYLGGPLDWTLIKNEVEEAVKKPTNPGAASKVTVNEVEIYHGVEVIEFIMQEPKQYGLWTGKYADNKRVSLAKDKCAIM